MRLSRLSIASILACAIGLLALAALAAISFERMQHKQAEISELLALQGRIGNFTLAREHFQRNPGQTPSTWHAFRHEAQSIQAALSDFAKDYPSAERARQHIDRLLHALEPERLLGPPQPPAQAGASSGGTDFISLRTRILMNQATGHAAAVNTALSTVVSERQQAIASEANRIAATFGGAAALFATGCMLALTLLVRRINGPVRALTRNIEQIRGGEHTARVPVRGHDEFTTLSRAFNDMLDQQQRLEHDLQERSRMLEIGGQVAKLGGFTIDLRTQQCRWTEMVARIHAEPAGYAPALDESVRYFTPEHQERIRACLRRCAEQGTAFDEEAQILTASGELRWIRVAGTGVAGDDGHVVRIDGAVQDISEQKRAQQAAKQLSDDLRHTLENISDAFFTLDRAWRFLFVNAEAERLLESSQSHLHGQSLWEAFPALRGSRFEQGYRQAMEAGRTVAMEAYYPPLEKWFDVRAYPSEQGLAVYFRDVTERHSMLEQLSRELAVRRTLLNSLPAHIALLDRDGNLVETNEHWREYSAWLGLPDSADGTDNDYLAATRARMAGAAPVLARTLELIDAIVRGERSSGSHEYQCPFSDPPRWFRMRANRLRYSERVGAELAAVVMHVDITERKLAEQELSRLAYQDTQTGLPNRHGFVHALNRQIHASTWPARAVLLAINITGLREVNDAHGYETGDRLLRAVGARLQTHFGYDTLMARTSGDEFVIFADGSQAAGVPPQEHIAALFQSPFILDELVMEISARAGYTHLGPEQRSVETLLHEAETALREARHRGHRNCPYSPELDRIARAQSALLKSLREAIDSHQFRLFYQPKVDLKTGRTLACEALLRWQHPQRGLLSPGVFIPAAEQSQLIVSVGDWVLFEACRQMRQWREEGLGDMPLSINVSVIQFKLGWLPQRIRDACTVYGIDPALLTLEVTESVFAQESDSIEAQMHALGALGVQLALDDFGTGYSSLLYLQKYPFDEVKIDMGFVRKLDTNAYNRKVVSSVIGLSETFGARTVAEGVETTQVRDALVQLGCHLGQGYLYGRPAPGSEFSTQLCRRQ